MERSNVYLLLPASGEPKFGTIDNADWQEFNRAIKADTGAVVRSRGLTEALGDTGRRMFAVETVDLWVDDEALLKPEPVPNVLASCFAGQMIHGDALVMLGTGQGESVGLPTELEFWLIGVIGEIERTGKRDEIYAAVKAQHEAFMKENPSGFRIVAMESITGEGGAA